MRRRQTCCITLAMGPYKYVADALLEEDQRRSWKERRTAKKIYDPLVDKTDSGWSDRIVRAYVREKRQELQAAKEQLEEHIINTGVGTHEAVTGNAAQRLMAFTFCYHSVDRRPDQGVEAIARSYWQGGLLGTSPDRLCT